jgi:hypothetical protein
MSTAKRGRVLYWSLWVLAALGSWLLIGWVAFYALSVMPYYDRKIDAVIAAAPHGAPSKEEVKPIELERSTAALALGIVGGILCGFAFGVAAHRFAERESKE